jgi:CubicO group peptidase (beta-lactamase class C family)
MKRASMLLAVVIALLTTTTVFAADALPTTKPEAVGLSSDRLKRLGQVLQREIDAKKFPGAVALVARKGKIAYFESFGVRDPNGSAAMTNDSIFRVYSMTKPWTSAAIMMLEEEGRLVLTDPVSKFLPQLKGLQVADATGKLTPAAREMTIQDLLRHTSGLTYGARTTNYFVKDAYRKADVDARELTNAELIDRLAKVPLVHQPGTVWEYSRSTDVLGRVVEVIAGTTLGGFFQERLFGPLKMTDSGFWVAKEKHARLAGSFATDPATGNANNLIDVTVQPKYESGGGGGVSTAADYVRFAQMMLSGGQLEGQRLISRTTVRLMTADHLGKIADTMRAPGYTFGLGFAVRTDYGLGAQASSPGEFNWAGAGGTFFWVDPKEEMVAILMTQAPGPSRLYYRQLFRQMVQQAIVD